MAKILITGGSGLVGRAISELLLNMGYEVIWLSREKGFSYGIQKFAWNVKKKEIDETAFEGVEYIIHLAGSGIIDERWTNAYKKEVIESRVKSSELLFDTIKKLGLNIKTLVGGSAVGYYGSDITDHVFKENDSPGSDFLAKVCVAWENSYKPFATSGIRTVIIRTGIVLSNEGGAYAKMVSPFKFGLGAAVGSGKQYFPWIHIKDLAGIFVAGLLNENLKGVYNAVASDPVTNKKFSKLLAKSLKRPFFLPNVPESAVKLALGERAVSVTRGVKISNEKIKAAGFEFKLDSLEAALRDLR